MPLIIDCPNCHAKYQYDEARFEGKPSKKIRCAKCQKIFDIHNPGFQRPQDLAGGDADSTMSRRATPEERAVIEDESTTSAALPGRSTGQLDGSPKLPEGRRLSLAIIEGPDAGKVFRIDKPRIVIGRSNADFVLNDVESSRAHAAIEVRDTVVFLEDLGSTNGTIVQNNRINGRIELGNQAEFQIGSTTLMLIMTDSE
jgi:predicted Zn finger-like uncharacterized protein